MPQALCTSHVLLFKHAHLLSHTSNGTPRTFMPSPSAKLSQNPSSRPFGPAVCLPLAHFLSKLQAIFTVLQRLCIYSPWAHKDTTDITVCSLLHLKQGLTLSRIGSWSILRVPGERGHNSFFSLVLCFSGSVSFLWKQSSKWKVNF